MARRSHNDSHKEGEKSHDDQPIEKKTDVLSSKTDKSNNKTDSNSTTHSRKELKMTFDLLTKHIQECVRKELKKNRKRKPKKYISSSSNSNVYEHKYSSKLIFIWIPWNKTKKNYNLYETAKSLLLINLFVDEKSDACKNHSILKNMKV